MQSIVERDIAHVVHPFTNLDAHARQGPLVIARGDGPYVISEDGRRFLEGVSGLWCASLGFSEQRLAEAAHRQMSKLPYYHLFSHRTHEPAVLLAEQLTRIAPEGLNHVLFGCSGSEANDAAIKLAWHYNNIVGRPRKKKVISRIDGYHGVTIASGSLTGLPLVHQDFDLPIPGVLHTDCPSHLHYGNPRESEADFVARICKNLEDLIVREGAETIAAFIAEPVNGAGGVIVPPPGYFERVQEILRRHDILFIVDEIICGFGRTGKMFGSETFGLRPDMMTVAKALSAAYQPISGLLISDAINDALVAGSRKHGTFAHGLTYSAHPVAAAVALETLRIYEERDIVASAEALAKYFWARLGDFTAHPLVRQVRGAGLLAAIELVVEEKAPSAADLQLAAFEQGLIVRAIGNCVALGPPLICEPAHIDELVDGLKAAMHRLAGRAAQRTCSPGFP